jgi:hypothetical protein
VFLASGHQSSLYPSSGLRAASSLKPALVYTGTLPAANYLPSQPKVMRSAFWRPPGNVAMEPAYAVIVAADEQTLEELRNYAYASAHKGEGSTEHWEESRGPETAFFFRSWNAAFLFIWHCDVSDIPRRIEHSS